MLWVDASLVRIAFWTKHRFNAKDLLGLVADPVQPSVTPVDHPLMALSWRITLHIMKRKWYKTNFWLLHWVHSDQNSIQQSTLDHGIGVIDVQWMYPQVQIKDRKPNDSEQMSRTQLVSSQDSKIWVPGQNGLAKMSQLALSHCSKSEVQTDLVLWKFKPASCLWAIWPAIIPTLDPENPTHFLWKEQDRSRVGCSSVWFQPGIDARKN